MNKKVLALTLLVAAIFLSAMVMPQVPIASATTDSKKEPEVIWTNWHMNPSYPFGGEFHTGTYPVWKNFTIFNHGDTKLTLISVEFPETSPAFKPSKYFIKVVPSDHQEWRIRYIPELRRIEFDSRNEDLYFIPPGGYANISIEFIDGPTDPSKEYTFIVTVSDETAAYTVYHLKEYIDDVPPEVEITFPGPESLNPDGRGYAFVKKRDGSIWVQMPNCTNKNIGWLWINGTAKDPLPPGYKNCSGINRVEIWINGTYMGDAVLFEQIRKQDGIFVKWWWRTDPSKNPSFWKPEKWYYVVARAYDNSVVDEKMVRHGSEMIPKTNCKETPKHWIFWFEDVEHKIKVKQTWVPGNGRIDIIGETGFYPHGKVEIWLMSDGTGNPKEDPYKMKIKLKEVVADNYGRFKVTINHLPEVPRGPTRNFRWRIYAIDEKGNDGSDWFYIVPWITYEPTMSMDDPSVWDTTKEGHVYDRIKVYGHGFLPSRHSTWDPYSTVYVRIVYTDVAPLENWDSRRVFNGTGQSNVDNLEWSPRLHEVVLAEVKTDENGYWSAEITIPRSFGGLHAIYAYEYQLKTDPRQTRTNNKFCTRKKRMA